MSTENLKALTLWRLRARLIFTGTVGGWQKDTGAEDRRQGQGGREAGGRGQETGAGRHEGQFRHYITEAAKKSPRTKIKDMEKANR